ncbi:CbtB domain-containing protein [Chthonobacter albigriseus]|uniref:CbtB domain-containing protein n=1 Tax=Chthonobacter albigriseus TaxID=1683161 RepID=UPI0015EF2423|nr:CbtB domain-containing protein [Chthonobacter albigriseus]
MNTTLNSAASSAVKVKSDVRTAALLALIAGIGLVFTTGFAHPELLHNAAHDWRHSMSFPCH